MKLSIAWIFDHIDADWRSLDIADIVSKFNKTTAEIEKVHTLALDLSSLHPVSIVRQEKQTCFVRLHNSTSDVVLSARTDLAPGQHTLVKKTEAGYVWASYQDLGGSRDAYLPALALHHNWKSLIEQDDTILEVDNKSITNRPDLWGHRGFAREIAALLKLRLKPLEQFLHTTQVVEGKMQVKATADIPWSVQIAPEAGVDRLALSYLPSVTGAPSQMGMAARLARIDLKCINALVDITNYVMADLGHPMHAFDAQKLKTREINARAAHTNETLVTLDGVDRKLITTDIVIADGANPISLAGVMGGLSTSVTNGTTSLLLEAGNFDATIIRHTAERLKVRTEASARFEKSLDPHGVVVALARFVQLAHQYKLCEIGSLHISAVGALSHPTHLELTHQFIESKLGITLEPNRVIELLCSIEFGVVYADGVYTVTVPSFRATKDITIAEDIVEEIGRLYGYDAIKPILPFMRLEPKNLRVTIQLRAIKQYLAYAHDMHELYSYALYDASFLRTINYVPEHTLSVLDPVSENWSQLVTSLIPHLAKAVQQNIPERQSIRAFEWARVWHHQGEVTERKSLAGIIFDKQHQIDFYQGKAIIHDLLRMCGLSAQWRQVEHPHHPWYEPYETAHLVSDGIVIGHVGMMHTKFAQQLGEGSGWIFEIDGDWLLGTVPAAKKYVAIAKFPESVRDVSVLIGRDATVEELQGLIAACDSRIVSVTLVDFFEKEDWVTQRSIALRYVVRDDSKTLTKQEVDTISAAVIQKLTQRGGTIR